jgi:hypothetical protein
MVLETVSSFCTGYVLRPEGKKSGNNPLYRGSTPRSKLLSKINQDHNGLFNFEGLNPIADGPIYGESTFAPRKSKEAVKYMLYVYVFRRARKLGEMEKSLEAKADIFRHYWKKFKNEAPGFFEEVLGEAYLSDSGSDADSDSGLNRDEHSAGFMSFNGGSDSKCGESVEKQDCNNSIEDSTGSSKSSENLPPVMTTTMMHSIYTPIGESHTSIRILQPLLLDLQIHSHQLRLASTHPKKVRILLHMEAHLISRRCLLKLSTIPLQVLHQMLNLVALSLLQRKSRRVSQKQRKKLGQKRLSPSKGRKLAS